MQLYSNAWFNWNVSTVVGFVVVKCYFSKFHCCSCSVKNWVAWPTVVPPVRASVVAAASWSLFCSCPAHCSFGRAGLLHSHIMPLMQSILATSHLHLQQDQASHSSIFPSNLQWGYLSHYEVPAGENHWFKVDKLKPYPQTQFLRFQLFAVLVQKFSQSRSWFISFCLQPSNPLPVSICSLNSFLAQFLLALSLTS